MFVFFLFKQKTAYEVRISDWSSDVCSSDLNFVKRSEKGKLYWYYEPPMTDGSRPRKYVGPDSDPAVASRVEGFGRLKTGFRERQRLVRALRAAGMPARSEERRVGDECVSTWRTRWSPDR